MVIRCPCSISCATCCTALNNVMVEMPFHSLFPIFFVVLFHDCKQENAVTGVMCLCVVIVVSPRLLSVIRRSLYFEALMRIFEAMLQHDAPEPPATYKASRLLPLYSFHQLLLWLRGLKISLHVSRL